MKPTPPPLSRRTLLRGAGAAMALPWLEAMAPAAPLLRSSRRATGRPPVRLACLFMPNGVLPRDWLPPDEGRDFTLPKTLSPLAPVRDQLLAFTNLCNKNAFAGEGHYVKTTSLLSGAPVHETGGRDIRCGTTVDQFAARRVGRDTLLPSLELGIDPVTTKVDMGYSTVYGSHVSWRSPTQPAVKEIRPRLAFDRLFRRARVATRPEDASVLDLVREEARDLRRKVGSGDRHKLEEYLESVRSLEQRIERAARGAGRDPAHFEHLGARRPAPGIPDFPEHVRLMLELIVLAFRTDTTRVASFMFGNSVSNRNFSFLDGVEGGFHHYSHHEHKEEKKVPYQLINAWHVAQLAWLAQEFRSIPEGEGTLLDHSILFFGSGIRDGNAHDPKNVPVVLVGGGGGRLPPGQHLLLPKRTPLCNLHLSMLHAMGVQVDRFGDSTGPLLVLREPADSARSPRTSG